MKPDESFASQLLIAMPGMQDPNFGATVTLICEHTGDGALGIVINRPMKVRLGDVLEQLELETDDAGLNARPVLDGGPVSRERGFVLHGAEGEWESTLVVADDIHVTFSRDILQSMAAGDGPDEALVALGYAGWDAGQLEQEILDNAWLSAPANRAIVFEAPFGERWRAAAELLGVDISLLANDAGHA